jgi:uroporphyrinogen III methyltransferase/synthase
LIVEQLLKHGRPADTPVAVVRWGTRPEQLTVMGRLADIVETVSRAKLQPPTVVVVGSVVRLREKLRWFDTKPLFGLRVLVTRSREQAGQLSALLARHGAYPIEFPVIATEPVADFIALDAALSRLAANDWVIFTSVNGVRAVVSRLRQRGQDVRAFGAARLCAIGPATAAEVERSGLRVDFVPKEYVAESIAAGIGDVVGKRILLPRSAIAREALAVDLRRRGALVEEVAAYRTTLPKGTRSEAIRARLAARELDMVAFTSSSTVRHFAELIRQRSVDVGGNGGSPADGRSDLVSLLEGVTIACIGPVTAKTAEEFGLHVAIRAKEFTIPGLVDAIVKWREGSVADVSRER